MPANNVHAGLCAACTHQLFCTYPVANGRVVGVELTGRDSEIPTIPAASLAQLKRLVGEETEIRVREWYPGK